MRFLPHLISCCLMLAAQPVWARPFTVDDLLAIEEVGGVAADPTGRRLVIEVAGPRAEAGRFDYGSYARWRGSRLLVVDLDHPGPARPLFDQPKSAGYVAGPFSPDGAAMVVYRLGERSGERVWEAGVARLANGEVHWLGVTPDLPLHGRAAIWRSDHELLLNTLPDGELPWHLMLDWRGPQRVDLARREMAEGRVSVMVTGAGRFRSATPLPPENKLLTIDTRTWSATQLLTAGVFDMELSPDGRFLALAVNFERIAPPQDELFTVSTPIRRRNLMLLDLDAGVATRPCPDCALSSHLLAWSPQGGRLLIHTRQPGGAGAFRVIEAASGRQDRLDLHGLVPAFSSNIGMARIPQAGWLGGAPVVRARPDGAPTGARTDWYRITSKGRQNLTAGFKVPPARIEAVWRNRWIVATDGALWRLATGTPPSRIDQATSLAPAPAFGLGQRFAYNDPPIIDQPSAITPAGAVRLGERPARAPSLALGGPETSALVATPRGLVSQTLDAHGRLELAFTAWSGEATSLLVLNGQLEAVDFADVEPIQHAGPKGEVLTSWLYLPHDRKPGERLPLVVMPYPGAVFPTPLADYGPGRFTVHMSPQLFAAQGYAVLVPSLPRPRDGEPARGLADQILSVVDAALARGDLDGDRLAMYGQSFGGYTALATATQTTRFKSYIAMASVSDLAQTWALPDPFRRAVPEYSPGVGGAGWAEGGQGAIGATPWADPGRYVRNSPLYAADRVTAPILLIHGSEDPVTLSQAEAMFQALWRQDKDVELALYWGEDHAILSPSNLRDLFPRMFDWLKATLPPPAAGR